MILKPYGIQAISITDFKSVDFDKKGAFEYKDVHFFVNMKRNNKNLVISFHGAIRENAPKIAFRGYDYSIPSTDIICMSDMLLTKYKKVRMNWMISSRLYPAEIIYKEIFKHFMNHKEYKNIIFTGCSAGGLPSIKFASIFNARAFVSNSQIYLEKYGYYHTWLRFINEKKDKTLYVPKEIDSIILQNKPKEIVVYNNRKDYTFPLHTIQFRKFVIKHKLEQIIKFIKFNYDKPLPKGKNHHHIQFPGNKSHRQALQEYIIKINN